MKKNWILPVGGGAGIGVLALVLWKFGNPPNMGFCTACFERDIAGALGLHAAPPVRLLRIEILGVVLGAFLLALLRREFRPSAGSAPFSRFVMGAFMMIGALVFLGCPLRMLERLGSGDLNAVVGFLGLAAGAAGGVALLRFSYDPPPPKAQAGAEGFLFPLLAGALLLLFALQAAGAVPAFLKSSESGPGIMYPGSPKPAPWAVPLPMAAGALLTAAAGLLVGALSQYTRFCSVGGIRHLLLARNGTLFGAAAALAVVYGAGAALLGHFKLGFSGQPLAHDWHIWNFLGLALVGLTGTLMDGCPLRQLVRAGQGDGDAAFATLGLIGGAAIAHNFGVAASPKGVPGPGQVAAVLGILAVTAIALTQRLKIGK